jgi:hypothetical protein
MACLLNNVWRSVAWRRGRGNILGCPHFCNFGGPSPCTRHKVPRKEVVALVRKMIHLLVTHSQILVESDDDYGHAIFFAPRHSYVRS